MRLVIVGRESFIARHMREAAQRGDIECVALPFDGDVADVVRSGDTVVNFAIHPAYKTEAYDEETDCDLKVARIAATAGARTIMVSSRKVYPGKARWNAREDDICTGDGSHYGDNKAATELRILAIPNVRATIFRLSNVCGYEYAPDAPRSTFFGIMLAGLKTENTIRFDMHPSTRRDFLPVEYCATAMMMAIEAKLEGTYNLGSGFALPCGVVAGWIMEGFGGGDLVVDPPDVRDEFVLNMEKWMARFTRRPITQDELRDYCLDIGRRLKCEKS